MYDFLDLFTSFFYFIYFVWLRAEIKDIYNIVYKALYRAISTRRNIIK